MQTEPKRLSRGSFLTALALSITGAAGILQGCSGGGKLATAITKALLIGRWDQTRMRLASGEETGCPGSIVLSGATLTCGGFIQFNTDGTFLSSTDSGGPMSGTWTLAGSTVTLQSAKVGDNTPDSVPLTITALTANSMTLVVAGVTYENTKSTNTRSLVKRVFTYTGAVQTFTVPEGVTAISIKAWGAGGGSSGGSGAFVTADVKVTPGETLNVRVGGGGQSALPGTTTPSAFPAGGTGTTINTTASTQAGAGGGRTAINHNSTGAIIAIAGSGGGGNVGGGGGGGGSNGLPGGPSSTGGGGGTQTAGGAGKDEGSSGSYLTGGKGGGAGGGAGFYGGGGAGSASGSKGGGGGSSYGGPSTTFFRVTDGRNGGNGGTDPGGAGDPDYQAGAGRGGDFNQIGGNGLVVISYLG